MHTTTSTRGELPAATPADASYRWTPWLALAFLAAFQVGTLGNTLIGTEEQARRIGFWLLAQLVVIGLWWTGRARHIAPVALVFCLEALKIACEKWAADVGQLRTTIAVLLLTASQIGLLLLTTSAWFRARPSARSFGMQLLVGSAGVYAGAVLFNMLVREVVRQ